MTKVRKLDALVIIEFKVTVNELYFHFSQINSNIFFRFSKRLCRWLMNIESLSNIKFHNLLHWKRENETQVAPRGFSNNFASCNIKKRFCNTVTKSDLFDFAAVLQQQKHVSGTNFSMMSTWPIVCNIYSAKKRKMMIIIVMLFVINLKKLFAMFKVALVLIWKLTFLEWFFYSLIILIKLHKIWYLRLYKPLLFPKNQVIFLKNWKLWRPLLTIKFNHFWWNFGVRSFSKKY